MQLGTVRAVGRFLEDPLDVPWPAVEFLAEQLEIGNASCVKKYVQRPQTPYEHAWEIRDRYGYRSFDDPGCAGAFARFLEGRAWTHCNVGLTPVIKPGEPALSRARLAHVDQYYVRAENHAAASGVLIDAQAQIPIARAWGGGLRASVDGLRFVVPVRTINAGPSPKYFGCKRGITWLNAVNDQVAGIGQMVVPGTLLGTNGAGKTSTMEVLEGLAPAARGAVRVLGCDPCRERALVRRRMGIMLQEGGFAPDLTVAQTGRMWAGTLSAPRPVAEALGLVSLGHRAGVAVRSLSGGERRRLDLAMAILGRPEVLFLDEPATGLDPQSRRRTWLLIRELLGAGTTVVLTTHYLEEAEELADRLAIMHRGRIVRTGTPAQVAASQPARISFELPGDSREPVPDIAGTRASVTGRTVLLQAADLQPALTALLGWANSRDLVLGALDARPASLAEAFHAVAASAGSPADDGNAKDAAA